MKNISIIIPAYNEELFIGKLIESILRVDYPTDSYEIVIVNDGSSDRTGEVAEKYPGVRLVNLPENVGRFECRRKGAEAAHFPYLLFIDAHTTVSPEILSVLNHIQDRIVNGRVIELENPGPFETFYIAIRRLMYRKYYQNLDHPFHLTSENFDRMPKGTGVLYVEKDLFLKVCKDLSMEKMTKHASDDTKLLRAMVDYEPILNHPEVRITYHPRTSFKKSIKHLYERGPKFIDYYFNPVQRNFWLVIILPLLFIVIGILGLFLIPISLWTKFLALLGLNLSLAFILARSLRELRTIFIMLPICVLIFYAGIVNGLLLKLKHS